MTSTARIHPTALIEDGVEIGAGTAIWDNVHVRGPARIGSQCIVGEKTYVAYGVAIGDRVKINAFVYLCTGVRFDDGVMISAGAVFTNDRFPRATTPDLSALRGSQPDQATLSTRVREGATIGARSVIGAGLTIGRFAMVGMGSVVTRSVGDFHRVLGHPARSVGAVCRCGRPIARWPAGQPAERQDATCAGCGRGYAIRLGEVRQLDPS